MPAELKLKHIRAFVSEEKDSIDITAHRILFTIPEIVDRTNEIVTTKAVYEAIQDKNTFAANPICLPCHQHRLEGGQPPCVGGWDTETARLIKKAVLIWLNYAWTTALGLAYWDCYSNKFMRAISIGFQELEWHVENRDGIQIRVITKIELFEISCVAVGCNPGALSNLKSIGQWDEEDSVPQNAKEYLNDKFKEIRDFISEQINEIKTLIIPDSDEHAKALLKLGREADDSLIPAEDEISDEQFKEVLKKI